MGFVLFSVALRYHIGFALASSVFFGLIYNFESLYYDALVTVFID